MRDELFRLVEALDDWMAGRTQAAEARASAERAALGALRSGSSFEEAFREGAQAFRAVEAALGVSSAEAER